MEGLIVERDRLIALLASLPVQSSVSEGGRSQSVSRSDVLSQIRELNQMIVEMGGPFVLVSSADTGY